MACFRRGSRRTPPRQICDLERGACSWRPARVYCGALGGGISVRLPHARPRPSSCSSTGPTNPALARDLVLVLRAHRAGVPPSVKLYLASPRARRPLRRSFSVALASSTQLLSTSTRTADKLHRSLGKLHPRHWRPRPLSPRSSAIIAGKLLPGHGLLPDPAVKYLLPGGTLPPPAGKQDPRRPCPAPAGCHLRRRAA